MLNRNKFGAVYANRTRLVGLEDQGLTNRLIPQLKGLCVRFTAPRLPATDLRVRRTWIGGVAFWAFTPGIAPEAMRETT